MAQAKAGRKARVSTVPANESKGDKFRRLAKMRVPGALAKIANVGKLAGSGYESTEEQRKKIVADMRAAVDAVEAAFNRPAAGTKKGAVEYDI